jgi:hypothetical protein
MRQRGTPEQLLPEIRAVRRELTGVLAALQAFDARLQAVADQHDTHRRAPVTQPHDLPTEARGLTDTVTDLNTRLGTLNARIQRSERVTTALATLLALIVIVGGLTIYLGHQVQRQAACQGRENDAVRVALQQRTDAANTERAAQRQLFTVLLDPTTTPTQQQAATRGYYAGLVAADKQRSDNPLPTNSCD